MGPATSVEPFRLDDSVQRLDATCFTLEQELGKGTFGTVYLGLDKQRKPYAVKLVDPAKTTQQAILRETYLLSHLRHPNIVHFQGVYLDNGVCGMVFDYCVGGCLDDWCERHWACTGNVD